MQDKEANDSGHSQTENHGSVYILWEEHERQKLTFSATEYKSKECKKYVPVYSQLRRKNSFQQMKRLEEN